MKKINPIVTVGKEDTEMADKHMRRCLAALVIRESFIKAILIYYYSLELIKIKKIF